MAYAHFLSSSLVPGILSWLSSLLTETGFKSTPTFADAPCIRGTPETLYQFDVRHGWHLGVGKYFVASTLALLNDLFPGSSVNSRFGALSST